MPKSHNDKDLAMGHTRIDLIALLEQDTPDVEGALLLLRDMRERDLTPDAITLRGVILEAVDRIESGKSRPFDLAAYLKDAANGVLEDIEDHAIEFDLADPQDSPGADQAGHLAGLFGTTRAGVPPMPGPDAAFLNTLRLREAIVARRIAGETPTTADLQAYNDSLTTLAQALSPLLETQDDLPKTL